MTKTASKMGSVSSGWMPFGLATCKKLSTGDNDRMDRFEHGIRANRIERSARLRLEGGDDYDLQILVERTGSYSSVPLTQGRRRAPQ
jgi:hypothetical protein